MILLYYYITFSSVWEDLFSGFLINVRKLICRIRFSDTADFFIKTIDKSKIAVYTVYITYKQIGYTGGSK